MLTVLVLVLILLLLFDEICFAVVYIVILLRICFLIKVENAANTNKFSGNAVKHFKIKLFWCIPALLFRNVTYILHESDLISRFQEDVVRF